jgi:Na+-transporting methylmalonyl-CoA/oxaloacetate decarboxylase gamma subunit
VENPITAALVISVLGMPLLFLALAVFYGLLSLITSAIRDRQPALPGPAGADTTAPEDKALLQAAALAVAIARAEAEQTPSPAGLGTWNGNETASQHVSPWWMLHHQRHIVPGRELRRSQ